MKKILAMVIAMIMVLGMVGCGKSEAPTSSDNRERAENVEVIEGTVNAPTEKFSDEHGKVVREEHFKVKKEDAGPDGYINIDSELYAKEGVGRHRAPAFDGSVHFYEYEDGYIDFEYEQSK